MNTYKSRDNNVKNTQGKNVQDFTKNLLTGSNIQLQKSQNILRSDGSDSDKIQVRNLHDKTTNKIFKIT